MMTLLKDSDRVVTGRLSSIDVKNFSSDEIRRVEIQYCIHDFRYFSHATYRMERGKERMDVGRVHGGHDIPAETAFTRTPFLACSIARALVAAFNAPLVRVVRTPGTLLIGWSTRLDET